MAKKQLILVVDDDIRITNFIRSKLEATGYSVLTAQDGAQGLEIARNEAPDLIILDLVMPRMDGFEMLRELRRDSGVPVIILSAREAASDKIKGLTLGADDYLPKPFNPDELVARIEAVRRRLSSSRERQTLETSRIGDVVVDFKKHTVTVRGQEKYFTRLEWLLLGEFARHPGCLLTYEELLTRVWGPEYRDDTQLLRTWVSRLRSKLETNSLSPVIRTIPKSGYIMGQTS